MSAYQTDRPRGKLAALVVLVMILVGLAAGVVYLRPRFESDPPKVQLTPDADVIGTGALEISIADPGAGLKSVTVTLSAGGTETSIASEQYAQPVAEKKLSVAPAKLPGIKEGPATLRV